MGKPAKKLELCSKHYTKAEIEAKKNGEVKLGITDLEKIEIPVFVKNDSVAYSHWKKHIKEYKNAAKNGVEVLTTTDIGMFALYCKTYSEYEGLLNIREKVSVINIEDILKLETAINKKMDMLIKMQDRLFLNPLAKVKNVPKPEKKKPYNPIEDEYDI